MKQNALVLLVGLLAAGCGEYGGPSGSQTVYALARVGSDRLPVPLNPDSPLPLLIGDTFSLEQTGSKDQRILEHTTVIQDGPGGKIGRSQARFYYQIENGTLVYDNCPIGSFCVASLVADPRIYQIVGDSLFEVTPVGANIPIHVYGLVRR